MLVEQLEELRKKSRELTAELQQSESDKQRHLEANAEEKRMYQQHLLTLQDESKGAKVNEKEACEKLTELSRLCELTAHENNTLRQVLEDVKE